MTQVSAALEAREAQAVKLGANQVIVIGDDSPDSPPAVTLELVDVSELHEDEDNARRGSVDEIDRSLEEFGQHRFCVATRDGRIVVGNHLYRTALRRGWKKIFVQWVDDDYNKGTRRGLADNATGDLATWDTTALLALHDEIDISDVAGFSEDALEELRKIHVEEHERGKAEEDGPPAAPLVPASRHGDVWSIGAHRLLCGDCTDGDNIALLMGDSKADTMTTDPPYGVSYVGKTEDALEIENDALSKEDLAVLIARAFDGAALATRAGAYWFATVPAGPLHLIFASDWETRGILRQIMVWAKNTMVLGHSEYHYKHEPILYGWMPNGTRRKNPDRTRTTLWEYNKPAASREHPTMKPVELFEQMLIDSSNVGDLVYDPFLGSGTSIIAAERSGRICYGFEIAPQYADVTVERWQNYTGKEATLEGDGRTFAEVKAERVDVKSTREEVQS